MAAGPAESPTSDNHSGGADLVDPQRTCVGCRRVTGSSELLRFADSATGVRQGRSLPGRGVWLCRDSGCLELALRRGAIARGLRLPQTAVDPLQVTAEFERAMGSVDPHGGM